MLLDIAENIIHSHFMGSSSRGCRQINTINTKIYIFPYFAYFRLFVLGLHKTLISRRFSARAFEDVECC